MPGTGAGKRVGASPFAARLVASGCQTAAFQPWADTPTKPDGFGDREHRISRCGNQGQIQGSALINADRPQ
jgi:hypothetical protein